MKMRMCAAGILSMLILVSPGLIMMSQDAPEDKVLRLGIGDPRFKDKVLTVAPNEFTAAETGKALTFAKMIEEMKGSRIIHVGETHNSLPMHDVQFKIIQALYEQDRALAIGLEMFPSTSQDVLTKWSLGFMSEDEFVREAQWYVQWNFNFAYYRKIFLFAKENRIPVYALNAPKDIITKIRMQGWDALTEEEKNIVPKPDLSHPEHRRLIRTIFESSELPPQMKGAGLDMMFEGLYRAQSAWDHVMAANAVKAVQKEKRRMVVLAGSGHLIYSLGINLRVQQRNPMPSKTVIGVFVDPGKASTEIARGLGDYVYGVAEEEKPAFPSVGLGFKKFKGIDNLVIDPKPIDGVARGRDFEKGDVVLSVDGRATTDINELRTYLARFKWDDEVKFRILRAAQEKEVVLKFQELPRPAEAKKEETISSPRAPDR